MLSLPSKNDLVEFSGEQFEVAKRDALIPGRVWLKGHDDPVSIHDLTMICAARLRTN